MSTKPLASALGEIRRHAKASGFSSKGNTFSRRLSTGNQLLFSIQSSSKSTATESLVSINYGVFSAVVARRLRTELSTEVSEAHWIGRIREEGRERWIRLSGSISPLQNATLVNAAITDQVLPDLLAHSTDEQLLAEWTSGTASGISEMQRLLYSAILVAEAGDAVQLRAVVSELRHRVKGTVHEGLVEQRLARAEVEVES